VHDLKAYILMLVTAAGIVILAKLHSWNADQSITVTAAGIMRDERPEPLNALLGIVVRLMVGTLNVTANAALEQL